jgi:hypothetical protein
MAWIKTITADKADAPLRECYEAVYSRFPSEYGVDVPVLIRPEGGTEGITAASSLIPEAMRHGMSTLAVLLTPDLPLTRRQHEMIATVVSALNSCFY